MRIGIDIDEVIADTLTGIIAFYNGTYGTSLQRSDFSTYDFEEIWGLPEDEMIGRWYEFFETDHFASVEPVAGALSALKVLKENGHELFIVTARPHIVSKKTEDWVDMHYPDLFSGIYFSNRHGLEGVRRKKSELCAELNIAVLVEDDMHHANDCAASGIDVLLLDHPWNQGELPERIHRVFSWDDVIRMVS